MASFKDYDVSAIAEKNVMTLPVTMPNGKETGETVQIVSFYHKNFRAKQAEIFRKLRESKTQDEEKVNDLAKETVAACVVGWSFEDECNHENIMAFFEAMPNMFDVINLETAKNDNFFGKDEQN